MEKQGSIVSIAILSMMLAALLPPEVAAASTVGAWTQLAPTGTPPSPRDSQTTVYDANSNRMIIFSGNPNAVGLCTNQTWVLTNANGLGGTPQWILLNPGGIAPTGSNGHSAVYDAATNRMIAFAANGGCSSLGNDVFVLTNANGLGGTPTWIQLSPTGAPPSLRRYLDAQMVYDNVSNRLILFGGCQCISFGDSLNDLWVLTNANGLGGTPQWIQLIANGAASSPTARPSGATVYNPATNRMILFGGGRVDGGFFNDVWVLSNANGLGGSPSWTQPSPTGGPPSSRGSSGGVYDPGTNRLTIFGGTPTGKDYLNDVWVLANADGTGGTPTWTQLGQSPPLPPPRQTPMVNDPATGRMMFFGGRGNPQNNALTDLGDVWVFTPGGGLPSFYIFGVESNATLTTIQFNSASDILSFSVTGPHPSVGHIRVFLAKSLISNITQLQVSINGSPVAFSSVETSDAFIISFYVNLSTASITMTIPVVTQTPIPPLPFIVILLLSLFATLWKRRLRRSSLF